MSQALAKILEETHEIKTHVVIERASQNAPPNHAAAVIPCEDGVMLLEVLNSIHGQDPIISLKANAPTTITLGAQNEVKVDFAIVETPGNYRSVTPMISKKEQIADQAPQQSEFLLRPVDSPDHTVMKRYMLMQSTYPIEHVKDSSSTSISIDFTRESVKLRKSTPKPEGGENVQSLILPFSAFHPKEKTIDLSETQKEFVNEDFFKDFATPEAEIKDQLFTMVEHRDTMRTFYSQVGKKK